MMHATAAIPTHLVMAVRGLGIRFQSRRATWANEMLSLRVTGTGTPDDMRMPLT